MSEVKPPPIEKITLLSPGQIWVYKGKIRSFPKKVEVIEHQPEGSGPKVLALKTIKAQHEEDWEGQVHAAFLITRHQKDWKMNK